MVYTLEELKRFKRYFDGLYEKGLDVHNNHVNDDIDSFDSLYESAIESMKEGDKNE